MNVCGIDFSSRAIDLVFLDEDTGHAEWRRAELHGQDAFERARDVRRAMLERGSGVFDDTVAVGIEDPRGYNAGALYRIQGAVLACIPPPLLVQPLIPSEWRKAVGLKGNASKPAIRSHAIVVASCDATRWGTYEGMHAWPQDACDAYCIALATQRLLERREAA